MSKAWRGEIFMEEADGDAVVELQAVFATLLVLVHACLICLGNNYIFIEIDVEFVTTFRFCLFSTPLSCRQLPLEHLSTAPFDDESSESIDDAFFFIIR